MIIEVLALIFVVVFTVWLFKIPKGMPPGEFGWPVIGSIPSTGIPLQNYIQKYRKKHGDVFTWKIGSRYFICLCDYNIIKSAFVHPQLQNRPDFFTVDVFTAFKKKGIINNHGPVWNTMRRLASRYLIEHGMGKPILERAIQLEVECLVEDFEKYVGKPTEVPFSLNISVLNIIWKLVADRHYELDDPQAIKFFIMMRDVFTLAQKTELLMLDLFPWMIPLLPERIKKWMGSGLIYSEYHRLLDFSQEAIDEHKKDLDPDNPRDLIDYFLLQTNKKNDESNEYLENVTESELLYTLADLFAAGSETASVAIRWILLYLMKYPKFQKKVQQQIDEVVPSDQFPGLEHRSRLPLVDALIHEVMRLKAPTPIGVYHCAAEETILDKYTIPKGAAIVSCMDVCHKDPKYWKNPEEFDPERFITADGLFDGKRDGFMPFSIGRRICIGESLAKMELYLYMAALLQRFTYEALPDDDLDTEPDPTQPIFSLPRQYKFVISKRN